jgi:HEAT repeat protein
MQANRLAAWLVLGLLAGCTAKPPYVGRSVADLEKMLSDPQTNVQVQGAYGLGLLGAEARPAVPALIRTLKADTPLVRQNAASALGHIKAEEAVPALVEALGDREWVVRRQAASALGYIGPVARAACEEPLNRCLQDRNSLVRKAAQDALVKLRE